MARILVADDDAVTCQLMSEVLSRDGSTVIGETDPRRALARAAEEHIDLAIVDVQMPDLDGLALLRTLRGRSPDLPVVIMTAFGSIQTAVDAIAYGAVDYVSKPMNVEEIRSTVQRVLGGAAAGPGRGRGEARWMIGCARDGRYLQDDRARRLVADDGPHPQSGTEGSSSPDPRARVRRRRRFVAATAAPYRDLLEMSCSDPRGSFTGAIADTCLRRGRRWHHLPRRGGRHQPRAPGGRCACSRASGAAGRRHAWCPDARVIAATNRGLSSAVAAGRFREDSTLPPEGRHGRRAALRERPDDVPLLVDGPCAARPVSAVEVAGVPSRALALPPRIAGRERARTGVCPRARVAPRSTTSWPRSYGRAARPGAA
jgi:CheY-like chemotaxis protein